MRGGPPAAPAPALASHPTPVREAIEHHRRAFDKNPALYFQAQEPTAASTTPYATSYPRLAPSLLNTPDDVDAVLRAVRELGAA